MQIHDKGAKADRDRAILLASYNAMCKEFKVKMTNRLTITDIAKMTNKQLFQASKDLYNGQPLEKALKLSNKLNKKQQEPWLLRVLKSWTVTPVHAELDETHAKVRYEAQRGQT